MEIDGGPWCKIPEGKPGAGIIIKDAIADITLQQVLTRPTDFDVIATLNLNGDYLSDALAAQVGGIGIAPGGNINYVTGHAIFEATHGTAPKYADKDMVNPGSVVFSGEMMFRYLGWTEAADLILKGLNGAIGQQESHLRFRAPDGRRDEDQVLRVRRQHHRAHVISPHQYKRWRRNDHRLFFSNAFSKRLWGGGESGEQGGGWERDVSAATAPARTSGRQRARDGCGGGKRLTAAKRKLRGWKSSPAKNVQEKFNNWLPDDTVEAFKEFLVGIKGPLTTPIGGGIRSLNVALRQMLDLYVCLRPVQWFTGVPSPVKHPEKVNMVIFRENTEDIYAGIDFEAGKEMALKTIEFLKTNFPKDFKKIRFGETPEVVGIGIKPVSKTGTQRLFRSAMQYAIANKRSP